MKIGLIGKGRWGKKLYKKLIDLKHEVIFFRRKDQSIRNFVNLDTLLISTPDNTHFKILNKFKNHKIKVFCEKPISRNIKELRIVNKFKKGKLYISDISNFYPNYKLNHKNFFFRSKKDINHKLNTKKKRYDLLYRFAYHDLGYVYKKIGNLDCKKIEILNSKGYLEFNLIFKDHIFNFLYSTNSKKKYTFNKKTFYSKKDILKKMISQFLNDKVNFEKNLKKALIISKTIELIKKRIYKCVV